MKYYMLILGFAALPFLANAQAKNNPGKTDSTKIMRLVEAACGQCQFGMPGKSCDLAVRVNGHAYFVNGADIDSFGDAHADDGFCNAVRFANVKGEVVDNKFKVTYFKLQEKN